MDVVAQGEQVRSQPDGPRGGVWPMDVVVALVAVGGALIALAEVNRLVAGVVSLGISRDLAGVVGPGALTEQARESWQLWARPSVLRAAVAGWIVTHVVVDAVFVLGYRYLLRRLLPRTAVVARRALGALLVAEAFEALLMLLLAQQVHSGDAPAVLVWAAAGVTTAKWAAGAVVLTAALRHDDLRRRTLLVARRTAHALWYQRLSVVVIIPVAALSLVPGPNIWDQLPDVERGWTDWTGRAVGHLVLAVVASALLAFQLFVLGRQRAERAWCTHAVKLAPRQTAAVGWFLAVPVLAASVALPLALFSRGELVDLGVLGRFLAVPVVVVVASWLVGRGGTTRDFWRRRSAVALVFVVASTTALLAVPGRGEQVEAVPVLASLSAAVMLLFAAWWAGRRGDPWRPPPGTGGEQRARDVWLVGDLLALAVLVVAGLGLVRSFTAPVLLGPSELPDVGHDLGRWARQAGLLLVGVTLTPLFPRWFAHLTRRLDTGTAQESSRLRQLLRPDVVPGPGGRFFTATPLLIWASAVVVLGLLVLWPFTVTGALGVVATTLVTLGCWAVAIGFFVVHLQHRMPLAVFRRFRLTANPILSLLAVVALMVTTAGGDPDLHRLRVAEKSVAPTNRADLASTFSRWYAASAACTRLVPTAAGDIAIRPLVLVAASGGGIRAAYWTTGSMSSLSGAGDCGPASVLLSSGVSGGSVGLSAARGENSMAAVAALAEPDALSAAVAGLLASDIVGGVTGLRVPALLDGQRAWMDRAALIETVWERAAPSLRDGFDGDPRGSGGALLLNSTAAGPGCRVLVSQVDLGGPVGATGCRALSALPAASLDLLGTYDGCAAPLAWSTAAMLSARFPTVTPAGRVARVDLDGPGGVDCTTRPDLQLVDGGYAEGSGVGALVELAPRLTEVLRGHNAGIAAGRPVVVPLLVFLEDETRNDLVDGPSVLSREAFVPLVGRNAKALHAATATLLQRASTGLADVCPPGTGQARCEAAVEYVRGAVRGGVVVSAPLTRPGVDAPLGWTLSQDSRTRLDEALRDQQQTCTVPAGGPACLQRLLDLLAAGTGS